MVSVLRTNMMLVFLSGIFGFCFWFVWGSGLPITVTTDIPVCFYNADHEITAPERVKVTLIGKRADLLKFNPQSLAWHIDAKTLLPGEQVVAPHAEQLFLPATIKMVDCMPIKIVTKETQS